MQFRCLLAGVALVLGGSLAAACDGGDDRATPLTATSTTAVDATTTTSPTTSTTLDFETEVKLAALELIEVRNDVFQNPDVARVDEYVHELCVCRDAELRFVRDFVAEGSHWTGPAIEPLAIRLDNPDPNGPSFTLIGHQPAGSVQTPSGARQIPEVAVAPLFVALALDADGEWRLNALDEVPIAEEDARRIIEESGLP